MSKTIEQRINALLLEGVDRSNKWMKVHRYVEPSEVVLELATKHRLREELQMLRDHHIDETHFLFDVIRELVKRCNACKYCSEAMQPAEGCLLCPGCGHSKG